MSAANALITRFKFDGLLNQDQGGRRIILQGRISGQPALLIAERGAFGTDPYYLSSFSRLLLHVNCLGHNDIYRWYLANSLPDNTLDQPTPPDIKINLIYPCTDKHIKKYSFQQLRSVTETPEIYQKYVYPYMSKCREEGRLNWVFNIIEGRSEQENVLYRFEEADKDNNYLLLPDLNWDRSTISSLHLLAIVCPAADALLPGPIAEQHGAAPAAPADAPRCSHAPASIRAFAARHLSLRDLALRAFSLRLLPWRRLGGLVLLAGKPGLHLPGHVRPAPAALQLPAAAGARFRAGDDARQPEPVAAPPLHQCVERRGLPPVAGPLHLPDVQQGLLAPQQPAHPQPQPHGREAVQVPPRRLRQGLQRPQQHEAPRARLPRHGRPVGARIMIKIAMMTTFSTRQDSTRHTRTVHVQQRTDFQRDVREKLSKPKKG